jgi:hypothetical protein
MARVGIILSLLGITSFLALGGCSFGPKVLERTHGRYNEAIGHVEQEELLRNIVHLRYVEPTVRLNVLSIAAQYELSGQAEAQPFFSAQATGDNFFRSYSRILPELLLSTANRPTITLDPADTSEGVRQLLTPINTDTLAFLAETKWPVSLVLRLWIGSLNGVPNAAAENVLYGTATEEDARYYCITELIQNAVDQGLLTIYPEEREVEIGSALPPETITAAAEVEAAKTGLRFRRQADGTYVLVGTERRLILEVSPGAETSPVLAELWSLLNLVPGLPQYDILLEGRRIPDPARFPGPQLTSIRAVPRSTAGVWLYLANGVEVPAEHVTAGLVQLSSGLDGCARDDREITRGLFEVHVCQGCKPPPNAYVAVKYRDHWYYIDDRDLASKATFLLLLKMSRIDFARRPPGPSGPTLTLPVGR